MLRIYVTLVAALMGLAFGSFLNVCVSRWPEGESVVHPRSHCRVCNRMLSWWENIPLISWLMLRGRCRVCRTWIGWRYPIVEFAVGALWAKMAWDFWAVAPYTVLSADSTAALYGLLVMAIGQTIFLWMLVALAALDAENMWLPDWLTYPGIALGVVVQVVGKAISAYASHDLKFSLLNTIASCLIGVVVPAGILWLVRLAYKAIRHREGLGLGDVKLIAMLGAWLGGTQAMLALFVGAILCLLAALVLLRKTSADGQRESWTTAKLPLGTFLCMGGIFCTFWGEQVVNLYWHWVLRGGL